MELLRVSNKTALPTHCYSTYKGIAFDGCYYYLTCPEKGLIVKYNKNFCEVERFKTCKPYHCISYNGNDHSFWVSNNNRPHQLFKLNHDLKEIDCITLTLHECRGKHITGISVDCKTNHLLISFEQMIISIHPDQEKETRILRKTCHSQSMAITAISPTILIVEWHNNKQYIALYDAHFHLLNKIRVPRGYDVKNIVFNPCCTLSEQHHFNLLATKNGCYSYVLHCVIDCNKIKICLCNYKICDQCCEKPCTEPISSCDDLIESIALIETSLSHILNAEGEKLQKIIVGTDNVEEILCANAAINDTIVKITHLEIILHDKLSTIKNYCQFCENDYSHCKEHESEKNT